MSERPDAAQRHALVLAAGAATRFGGGKLTAIWRGEPVVVWSVRAALATRVDGVTVVLGASAGAVHQALTGLADRRLRFVDALNWAEGQSASLKAGLQALPADARAVAVFLGDMPAVDPALADSLLDAVMAGAPAARGRSPSGPAHPTAFGAAVFPALAQITGDQGGRSVLETLGAAVVTLEVEDPGAVFDIDRPEDLDAGPMIA